MNYSMSNKIYEMEICVYIVLKKNCVNKLNHKPDVFIQITGAIFFCSNIHIFIYLERIFDHE